MNFSNGSAFSCLPDDPGLTSMSERLDSLHRFGSERRDPSGKGLRGWRADDLFLAPKPVVVAQKYRANYSSASVLLLAGVPVRKAKDAGRGFQAAEG